MPIYPYVCTACGHEFDALQKISDDPLTECRECGEPTLRKRLAAPAFQLKGTGWYETDFKNSGKKQETGDKDQSGKDHSGKDQSGKDDSGQQAQASDNKDQGSKSSEGTGSGSSDSTSRSKAAAGADD